MRWIELAAELRRRKVFRTTGVYFVAVFGVSQGAAELMPLFGAPDWVIRALVVGLVALTPLVVLLAWRFDIGAEGVVRDPADVEPDDLTAAPTLSDMPTLVSSQGEEGCLRVAWSDESGGHSIVYPGEISIGRGAECQIRILDPLVSRSHAQIGPVDGFWTIRDLGSTNGTRVDGKRVSSLRLPPRSEVRLNDAGPTLTLDVIAPGDDTRRALAEGDRVGVKVEIPLGGARIANGSDTEGG